MDIKEQVTNHPVRNASVFSIVGIIAGYFVGGSNPAPEQWTTLLPQIAQNQIAQACFFFTVASWIHSGRVGKEIKSNFVSLTQDINNLATSVRSEMKTQKIELDSLTVTVQGIENKLNKQGEYNA